MSRVDGCRLVDLPRVTARQGNLTSVEGGRQVPFEIARVYYLYDLPGGESRGGHAHRELEQLLVCVMGSFDVTLDEGRERRVIHLDRAYKGLLIRPMIWRELANFSSGAICLVLASRVFSEADYIRDYGRFVEAAAEAAR